MYILKLTTSEYIDAALGDVEPAPFHFVDCAMMIVAALVSAVEFHLADKSDHKYRVG